MVLVEKFVNPFVTMLFKSPVFRKFFLQLLKLAQLFVRHQNVYVVVPRNETLMTNRAQEGSESHLI